MKSSYSFTPIQRALVAATVVLAAGNAALAQSSSSRDSSSSSPSSSSNSSYSSPSSSSSGSSQYGSGSSSSQHNTGSSSSQYGSSGSSHMSGDQSSSMSSSSSSSDKLSWGDRRFVTKAADSGQEEVQIAQLAAQKANNPDVKQFAQQLVDQHTQVNQQLMSMASSKNVKIDQDDVTKDRTYRRLNKASGNDFDREFVEHMVDQHEKDIKLYEKAAQSAKDSEVRQFASSTLEHLRQHLTQVQQLQQSIVPTGRDDSSSWRSSSGSSSSTSPSSSSSSSSSPSSSDSSSSFGSGSSGSGSSGSSSYDSSSSGSSSGGKSSSTTTTRNR